jgi:hypothetical protein
MTTRRLFGRPCYSLPGTIAIVLAGAVLQSAHATVAREQTSPAYSQAVIRVCSGALLFENEHEIGTRAGALAVSRDIRATGRRRLQRVDEIPKPAASVSLAAQWIELEKRLVDSYARTYLRIWYTIEHAHTANDRAHLPALLHQLVHAPDVLARHAATLEARLRVPDCTGGTLPPATPPSPTAA